uniref:Uncharacterized protein AlNc14C89G5629 n=1 Tax=Albugo laibachii Nc14 TaxID=890382 RepID=F0WG99_9STRA|nr:conserved hypothetical protein [Albugo laibachii Nc14]|eukprot:CCA20234.1 conserved hypothetical protein [Albugo laibachii Nc14]
MPRSPRLGNEEENGRQTSARSNRHCHRGETSNSDEQYYARKSYQRNDEQHHRRNESRVSNQYYSRPNTTNRPRQARIPIVKATHHFTNIINQSRDVAPYSDQHTNPPRKSQMPPRTSHSANGHRKFQNGSTSSYQESSQDFQSRRNQEPRQAIKSRKHTNSKKCTVPDNWSDVPKIGNAIGSSRIVALRVFLDHKYSRLIQDEEQWTPTMFCHEQKRLGHDVRLVIDLTNTDRYYDGFELEQCNIRYLKLPVEGFRGPPSNTIVNKFIKIVEEFITTYEHGTIAVHCTHGLNRTGYVVIHYLVRKLGFSLTDAIQLFTLARPPGLIKYLYIKELYRKLAPTNSVKYPELPAWANKSKYSKC